MKKIISLLLISLIVQLCWAQSGEGYNPENPADPQLYYSLTLESAPKNGGSVTSHINTKTLTAGTEVYCYANPKQGYKFKQWMEGEDIVSVESSFSYTMPDRNVTLVAYFDKDNSGYNPENPEDPSTKGYSHKVSLYATPSVAGSFNSSYFELCEGDSTNIYAYPKNGYRFEAWLKNGKVYSVENPLTIVMGTTNQAYTAKFSYNPENPNDPGANVFNTTTGALIVDRFKPGYLYSAISDAIGQNNYSSVQSILVSGVINSEDLGFSSSFSNCATIDMSRTSGYTEIPSWSFEDCYALTSIILPSCIQKIGKQAFEGCNSLSVLTCYALIPPTLEKDAFGGLTGLVVKVPASALAIYKKAEGWKEFSILPLDEETSNIVVNLPIDASDGRYNNMYIELQNTSSGQILKNLISNGKTSFAFVGLLRDCKYDVAVRTSRGTALGEKKDIALGKDNLNISFNNLLQPQNIALELYLPDGNKIEQSKYSVSWIDALGDYICQGQNIAGLIEGETVEYNVSLAQELAENYKAIEKGKYTVKKSDNVIGITLAKYSNVNVKGIVKNLTTGQPVVGAIVAVSQTLSGKYAKTFTTTSDAEGKFSLEAFEGKGKIAISASNYITQNIDVEDFASQLSEINLKPITGATVQLLLTYKESVVKDSLANNYDFYSDNDNITYIIYNKTKDKRINNYSVQYPSIILLEPVDESDELYITAHSKNNEFADTKTSCTIDAYNRSTAYISITQYGAIKSTIASTNGNSYIGILYDNKGQFVSKSIYKDGTFSISNIVDGEYTLVSMLNSKFFNTIGNIEDIKAVGLIEGQDYAVSVVEVRSGLITELAYETLPVFNESKFYYTGTETSFIANKASTTIGNYVTLRGKVDFKPDYANSIRGTYLVVDIPESCKFVENSVLTGKGLASYTLDGNKLNIPLEGTDNNVRFCIIPTQGGDFNTSASVQFELNNDNIVQPIGAAYFRADNLSLNAPEKTPNKTIAVSGNAPADSDIKVYDNDVLVCQTKSMANGYWGVKLPLVKPYSHSFHKIYGETTDMNGNTLLTDTKTVEYDESYVVLSKVSMIYNGTTVVFDEINGSTSNNTYSYAPSVTDFTFVADFTSNDTTKIGDVVFKVLASDGTIRSIDAKYNESKKEWVAKAKYKNSNKLPVNVTAEYNYVGKISLYDEENAAASDNNILDIIDDLSSIIEQAEYKVLEQGNEYAILNMYNGKNNYSENIKIGIGGPKDILQKYPADCFSYEYEVNGKKYVLYYNIHTESNNFAILDKESDNVLFIEMLKKNDTKSNSHIIMKNPIVIGSFVGGLVNRGMNYWQNTREALYYEERRSSIEQTYKKEYDKLKYLLNAKCSDGTYRLHDSELRSLYISLISTWYYNANSTLKNLDRLIQKQRSYERAKFCLSTLTDIASIATENTGTIYNIIKDTPLAKKLSGFGASLIMRLSKRNPEKNCAAYEKLREDLNAFVCDMVENNMETDEKRFEWSLDELLEVNISNWFEVQNEIIQKNFREYGYLIQRDYSKCPKKKDNEEDDDENNRQFKVIFVCPGLKPAIDPSGYVYEGVPSNRLEGVTASIYYKETTEDMYGELHDKVVLWDASEYAQENPLFTDEEGMYAWDVPQGLWQVKLEKNGYETAYSEWLPVPPPQLDVNIGMTQNSQPEVKTVHAYEDGVEIEFSKYMQPNTLTTANILVSVNGKTTDGTTELLNAEDNPNGNSYASKVRFIPPGSFKGDNVMLTISNKVKSYAGVAMQETFSQEFQIEQKLNKIETDSVVNMATESEYEMHIHVLPANSAAGKTLNIATNSPLIVSISEEALTIDDEGNAKITINGELPGSATLTFSIEGYTTTGMTQINVIDDRLQMTDKPVASIVSGSKVNKGTTVSLSCATEDAIIYYTLDGSCPCENSAARMLYDGTPIAINKDTQIRAIAYSEGLYESEVVSFFYTISDASGVEDMEISKIEVYPTVTKNVVNVNIKDGGQYNIIVANVSGTLITSLESVTGKNPINLAGLPSGMYVVAAYNNKDKYVVKVIKID